MKKIIIAGGTGFIGQSIGRYFSQRNWVVVVFSRANKINDNGIQYVKWDGERLGYWTKELEGADVLLNLCGRSVDCRYTHANRQAIYNSRIDSTHILGEAIQKCIAPPRVWINAASATIYRHATDRPMDEYDGELGKGFSVDVCKKWEATFSGLATGQTRKVLLRIAIVMGRDGGVLRPLTSLAKVGLGGKQGDGKQYVSWVHEQDLVRVVDFIIKNKDAVGVYNVSSPNPVKNHVLMKEIRKVYGKSFGLPLPKWVLKIGAKIIGTETELILKSRWVLPARLLEAGFRFNYANIATAIPALSSRQ